jgi:hypothetical protein
MSFSLTGPNIVTPGVAYTYTVNGWSSCVANETEGTIFMPPGWILVSQTPIVGNSFSFTVIAGSSPGSIEVYNNSCSTNLGGGFETFTVEILVSIGNNIQSNIGICCSNFATASLDTSTWTNNSTTPVTLTITFGNQVDATAALGAYTFTSTSNVSLSACLANLVSQINAAAAANPGGNPEGTSPASLIAGQLNIVSWPTANDATECGNTTNYLFGFEITCSIPGNVTMLPATTANFIGGGNVINCIGPPSITGNPFVCTNTSCSYTVTFPYGVPANYTVTPPPGWTLVSTVITGTNTIVVTLLPNSSSGTLVVSNNNGVSGYTTDFVLINDCFVSTCAAEMLLSQFCNDIDPCCITCQGYDKTKKEINQKMYNKAVALVTMYALMKQNYFINCDPLILVSLQNMLQQINSILIRCGICPQI